MVIGQAQAATTASFDQTSWVGGATTAVPVEPTNRTAWTQYSVSTAQTATTITLPIATTTVTQTSDATAVATGFKYGAYATATTTVTGTGTSTSVLLGSQSATQTITTTNNTATVATPAQQGGWAYGTNASTVQNGLTGDSASVVLGSAIATPALSAKYNHSLALKSDGTVWAWGHNTTGQLGDGSTTQRTTPVQVSTLTGVTSIAAGAAHSLALKSDGTVWAWGVNTSGQLGDGSTTQRTTPVQVKGVGGTGFLTGVIAIAAGQSSSLALKSDGTVWAWGSNTNGQLGDGSLIQRTTPVQVKGVGGTGYLTDITAIAGGGIHSLALRDDGTVWAWGYATYGQTGDGVPSGWRTTPVQVKGVGGTGFLTGVTAIAAGYHHSLALKSDGTVWAWGWNQYKQLGDGTQVSRSTPVQVVSITGVTAIFAGQYHALALKSDETVWAWGANGSLDTDDKSPTYLQYFSDGRLGSITAGDQGTPIQTPGLVGVATIGAGEQHSLALKSDGTVWAWGVNWNGQLGDGTQTDRTAPVQSAINLGAGVYTSYLDAGGAASYTWNSLTYTGQYPSGSTLSIKVKGSTTASAPSFASGTCDSGAVATNGSITLNTTCAPTNSRYLWYQVTLANGGNTAITPSLDSVTGSVTPSAAYYTSGTFTSGVIDTGVPVANWGNISWTNSGGQTVSMKVRTGASSAAATSAAWGAPTTVSGTSFVALGATAGHQYIQYQATLSTANTAQSPSLDDVTITYGLYATTGSVTSSAYNSTSAYNVMTGLVWKETASLPSGTTVTVSLRTGTATSTLGSWTAFTNATAGCTKSTDTVTCASSAIPAAMKDGSGDQYFQYKVDLTSTGQNTPTVSEVKPSYIYNVPPAIASITASQITSSADANYGKMKIDFSLRDADSTTLTATTTFEYSTSSTWTTIPTAQLTTVAGAAFNNVGTVATGSDTAYSAYWNVQQYLTNADSATFKVRITAVDGDVLNGTASSTSVNATVDTVAPTGGIVAINAGTTYASSTSVTLNVTVPTDTNGPIQMAYGNTASPTNWTTAATSITHTLATGDGTKTVYMRFKDAVGNTTTDTTDTIILDTTDPASGGVLINAGAPLASSTIVTLNITMATDVNGPVEVAYGNADFPTNWTASTTSVSHTMTTGDGTKTIRVRFRDAAGNITSQYTDTIVLDTTAPIGGSFKVNADAANASTTAVTLNVTVPTDASQIAYGNTASPANWTATSTSIAHTLATGDGTKTVYMRFIDAAGNATTDTTDTITLDTTAPTGGGVSINAGAANASSTTVTLNITAPTDAWTPLQMAYGNTFSPTNWTAVTTSKAHTLDIGDGTKTVYIKFRDAGGNTANYSTDSITLDTTAPTGGSFKVNADATTASSTSVTLNVTVPTDANGPVQMAYGNTASPTNWTTTATTKAHTLTTGDGTKTVYMRFKDAVGNTTTDVTDTIALDTTAPTGSIVINAGAANASSTSATLTLAATDAGTAATTVSFLTPISTVWDVPTGVTSVTVSVAGGGGEGGYAEESYSGDAGSPSSVTYDGQVKATAQGGGGGSGSCQVVLAGTASNTIGGSNITGGGGAGGEGGEANNCDGGANGGLVSGGTLTVSAGQQLGIIVGAGGGGDAGNGWVTISYTAPSAVTQMAFSTDGTNYSAYESYATSKAYTLPSTQGTSTVYVKYTDAIGNISTAYSDGIFLDTAAPSIASFTTAAYATSTTVSLTMSASDAGTGIANILLSNDGVSYTSTTYATTKSWTVTEGDGTKTVYLQVVDNAGNTTTASTATVTLDTANPTGSISIPTYSTTNADLTLSGADANTVTQMQFSNEAGAYSALEAYATTKTWPLSTGDGLKSVNVKFVDGAGNVSSIYTATTTLDSTAPSVSLMQVNNMLKNGSFETDSNSDGVAENFSISGSGGSYTLDSSNYVFGSKSQKIVKDVLSGSGYISQIINTPVNAGETVTYSVWVKGENISGAQSNTDFGIYVDSIGGTLETTTVAAPVGTFDWTKISVTKTYANTGHTGVRVYAMLRNKTGTAWFDGLQVEKSSTASAFHTFTNTASVKIHASSTDALSGVNQIDLSNDGVSYTTSAYAPVTDWELTAGDGVKTVSFKTRDNAGNVSGVSTATITLDTAAPSIASFTSASPYATSTTVSLTMSASDAGTGIANILLPMMALHIQAQHTQPQNHGPSQKVMAQRLYISKLSTMQAIPLLHPPQP
ncbi:TPA: hypothetical protein DDX30_03695 [Candidatus Wolfebacteria bacterium]|nr:hypothetical protein [Candidatus Wolfebacteria bacterium]